MNGVNAFSNCPIIFCILLLTGTINMKENTKPIAGRDEIIKFIPQRPPMVMVEKLLAAKNGITISTFTIRTDNIFLEDDHLQEPGLLENIAQTAALGVGFEYKNKNEAIPTGYIGAIQNVKIDKLPKCGEKIKTWVEVENEVFNTTLIKGEIYLKEELIVRCTMKIFLDRENKLENTK